LGFSRLGLTPSFSRLGLTPSFSRFGLTPSFSHLGLTPGFSHLGLTPSFSRLGLTPGFFGFPGFELRLNYMVLPAYTRFPEFTGTGAAFLFQYDTALNISSLFTHLDADRFSLAGGASAHFDFAMGFALQGYFLGSGYTQSSFFPMALTQMRQ
jgi:hypothetical protein